MTSGPLCLPLRNGRQASRTGLGSMRRHRLLFVASPGRRNLLCCLLVVFWIVGCSSGQGRVKTGAESIRPEGADAERVAGAESPPQAGHASDPSLSDPEATVGGETASEPLPEVALQGDAEAIAGDQIAAVAPSETDYESALSPDAAESGTVNPPPAREEVSWEEDGIREEYGEGYTRVILSGILGEEGYKYFVLDDPPRLVIDVREPARHVWFHRLALRGDAFLGMRVGRYLDRTRFVLDIREQQGQPAPVVQATDADLVVLAGASPGPDRAPVPMGGPEVPLTVAQADWRPVRVKGIDFHQTDTSSDVLVSLDRSVPFDVQERDDSILVILPGAQIPDHLQRPIDTKAFPSAILAVHPEQVGSGPTGKVMLTIRLREKRPYNVLEQEKGVRLSVLLPESPPEIPLLPPPALPETAELVTADKRPLRVAEEIKIEEKEKAPEKPAPAVAPEPKAPKAPTPPPATPIVEKHYTGKRISLDFKDADIQNVLRLIAEVSGKNIVISEAVKGKATIRLLNIPWDMALDVILKTYALDKEELAPNILRVAPYTQLQKERDEALRAAEALQRAEELQTRVIPLNYAKARDLEALLEKLKSRRPDATIMVDVRTNALIIKDLAQNIQDMEALIRSLDTQTPQVLIEAKIVELDVEFQRELGIQWGAQYMAGPATGNPTGMNFPHTANIGGAVDNISGQVAPGIGNPIVNLPAAVDNTAGGAMGFSLASLTNSFQLDAQLSALEKRNHARVLSSPRVATLNNQEAKINQGQEVPFQTTSDMGTQTEFKEAKLQLSVTPQITFDRSIIMNIVVTNDTPIRDPTVGFIIATKEARTAVLVKDGDTAVIGGIYTNNESEIAGGVPVLMDIPIAGNLFRKRGEGQKRTELVIFITPRIIPTQSIRVDQWTEQMGAE